MRQPIRRRSAKALPSSRQLFKQAFLLLKNNWREVGVVFGVYVLIDLVFGSGATRLSSMASNLNSTSTSGLSGVLGGFGRVSGLSNSSGGSSSSSILPTLLVVFEILLSLWVAKRLVKNQKVELKEAYYTSTGSLIPFLLVLAVLLLQLLPLALGSLILVSVFGGTPGILAGSFFVVISAALGAWSIYMLSNSIFAPILVSESGSEPIPSLRASKQLAAGRRWQIIGRLLALIAMSLAAIFIVELPLIWLVRAVVPLLLYLLEVLIVPFLVSAIYLLFEAING